MSKPVARKRSMSMYEIPKVVEVDDDHESDDENEDPASESEDDETPTKDVPTKNDSSEWTLEENEQLFEEVLRELPGNDNKSYRSRMKILNWSAIKVEGRSADECLNQMNKLFKNLRHVRTMAELMEDAKAKNDKQKEPKGKKPKATRAKSAFNLFCSRLRETGKFTNLTEAAEAYKKVEPEEKFEFLKVAEKNRVKKLYDELAKLQTTPYTVFVKGQYDQGKFCKRENRAAYRQLEPTERLEYIRLAVGEVSSKSNHQITDFSFLTNEELRMMHGGQSRPRTSYNLFIRDYCGNRKLKLKDAGEAYRNLSNDELQKYKKEAEELNNTLNVTLNNSRIHATSENGIEPAQPKKEKETPTKKKRTSEVPSEDLASPFKTPSKRPPRIELNGSSEKKRKLSLSSSESGSREVSRVIKKEKVAEPERVPTSLFQYYIQNEYTGKPKKAEKSFKKLSKEERKRMKRSFKNLVADYMTKLELYLKTLSKEEMNAYAKRSHDTTIPAGDSESDTSFSSDVN